jgi:ribosomal protein S18
MYNKEHVDILKHFITETDKFRNRSINDYLPELWKELDLGSRIFGDTKQR